MNFQTLLNNSITDLTHTLHNDFVMQEIVARLVDKINQAQTIKKETKLAISRYFSGYHMQKTYLQPVEFKNIQATTPRNLLLITIVYLLSNLNIYDEYLINYAFNIGLQPNAIIVLLLVNNIYDIEFFCDRYNIGSDGFYNISVLKKLSELHKLQFNYY